MHDIPELERLGSDGWAACTTDEIIATKSRLFDVVVDMGEDGIPSMKTNEGNIIRASQRDAGRYRMLHRALAQCRNTTREGYWDDEDDDQAPLLLQNDGGDEETPHIDDALIEPTTWSRLAYSGFMWWASAGERDASLTAEREFDRELLAPLTNTPSTSTELAVISYFHRLTSTFVQNLSRAMDERPSGEGGYDDENEDAVLIGGEELGELGLDGWSESDRAYLQEFCAMWWGREVQVRGREVECCGMRVPVL